jgi:hypothetical protein
MPAVARLPLAMFASLLLAACDSPAPETDSDQASADTGQRELDSGEDATVFDDMLQTQDKARAVEGLTLGRKGELDQALDAQTGDDADPAE